jgi:hypothetical protein
VQQDKQRHAAAESAATHGRYEVYAGGGRCSSGGAQCQWRRCKRLRHDRVHRAPPPCGHQPHIHNTRYCSQVLQLVGTTRVLQRPLTKRWHDAEVGVQRRAVVQQQAQAGSIAALRVVFVEELGEGAAAAVDEHAPVKQVVHFAEGQHVEQVDGAGQEGAACAAWREERECSREGKGGMRAYSADVNR